MTENKNRFRRVGRAVEGVAKKNGFYLVIGILSIVMIFSAGMLNLWKDLVEAQQEWLETDAAYMESILSSLHDDLGDDLTTDDLLRLVEVLTDADSTFYSAVDNYYVCDSETGTVIGDSDTAGAASLPEISERNFLLTKGRLYGTIPYGNRYSVILEVSTDYVKDDLLSVLPARLRALAAAIVVYLLLLWLATAVFWDERKRDRAVSAILFLLLAVLIAMDAYTAVRNQAESLLNMEDEIYENVDAGLKQIAALSDEDVLKYTRADDAETGRWALVEGQMDCYDSMTDSIDYDPATVMDQSISITDRVQVIMKLGGLSNALAEYLLETVMYAILAVVLFRAIAYYKDDLLPNREKTAEGTALQTFMDRLKLIITVKGFADALMITVTVKLLNGFLKADLDGALAGRAVNWTVLAATWIAVAALLIIPRALRRAGGSAKLLPVSLAVYTTGSLLCFLAQDSLIYIIGYLILAAGDTVYGMMYQMVPYELTPPDQNYLSETRAISMGRRVGQIIGYVVGGTLVSLIPYRFMFLIASVLSLGMLIPAIQIAGVQRQNTLPDRPYFFRTLLNRRMILFLLMVDAPYAMVGYYFKYVVPLNVEALGLTTTLVSFLFFFRMLMKLVFKREDRIRAMWKKVSTRTGVLLCMFLIAAIFYLMERLDSVTAMLLLTMLLALLEARYGGLVFKLGAAILGKNQERYFGFCAGASAGCQLGKSVAAALTNAFGATAIPAWMGGSAIVYLLTTREGKSPEPPADGEHRA